MEVLTRVLTFDEVLEKLGDGTRLVVYLALPLADLIDYDLDHLEKFVDEFILPDDDRLDSSMEDITYKVVGHLNEELGGSFYAQGKVILEVSGTVEIFD